MYLAVTSVGVNVGGQGPDEGLYGADGDLPRGLALGLQPSCRTACQYLRVMKIHQLEHARFPQSSACVVTIQRPPPAHSPIQHKKSARRIATQQRLHNITQKMNPLNVLICLMASSIQFHILVQPHDNHYAKRTITYVIKVSIIELHKALQLWKSAYLCLIHPVKP